MVRPGIRASEFNQAQLAELHALEAAMGGRSIMDYIPRVSPVMPGGVRCVSPNHLLPIADQIALAEYRPVKVCVSVPPRHGKQIADSYPILTPDGWRAHGDLRPGDRVYAVDGSVCRVTGRHGGLPCDLELVTSDGEVVPVHAEHLWEVVDRRSGSRPRRVMTTAQLRDAGLLLAGVEGRRGSRWRFQLPNVGALEGDPAARLPFEPYFLGVWLGDGSSDGAKLSMSPADAVDVMGLLEDRGHRLGAWWRHPTTGVVSWTVKGLGVGRYFRGRKRIPDVYLRAGVEQRRELLRGLVDSDGSVEPRTGRVRVVGVDERLVKQVAVLARTLGYRASVHRQEPAPGGRGIRGKRAVFIAQWTPHDGARQAWLARKDVRAPVRVQRMRAVVDVRPAARPEVGHCIAVDHPSRLYLVGERLVPTHNTELIIHSIAWWLQRHPEHTIAYCSYSGDLANGKSVRARDIALASGVVVRPDQNRASEWRTWSGGGLLATGVGGPLTGQGCNLLIVDDPIKNREEAESTVQRQKVWEWFTSTAMTRPTPDGSVIVVHTRWHGDDLIGRLAKKGGWHIINLPVHDESGAYLWPEGGWDQAVMEARRAEVGEYDWAALFMGEPRPRGGRMFEEPACYDRPTVIGARLFVACDPAATKATHADYSAIIVGAAWLGPDGMPHIDVLDVWRGQVEQPRLVQTLQWYQEQYRAPIGIESVGGFKGVAQSLRQVCKGVRIVEIPALKDKFTRALPVSAAWNGMPGRPETRRIRVPRAGALNQYGQPAHPWRETFLSEVGEFTGVGDAHDDQVDALAHLYYMAHHMLSPRRVNTPAEIARYLPFG